MYIAINFPHPDSKGVPKLSNDEELLSSQCVNIKQETTDNIIEVDHLSADSKENQGVHIFKPALDLVDVKIEEKEGAVLEDDENKPIKVKKTKKKYKKHASSLHDGTF